MLLCVFIPCDPFTDSLLSLLPKEVDASDKADSVFRHPEQTRPLAQVTTDAKAIANAVAIPWFPPTHP